MRLFTWPYNLNKLKIVYQSVYLVLK